MSPIDEEVLLAAVELVGITGAKEFQIGWLHDDVPDEDAGWYAHAQFKGARITEEAVGPVEAAEGLARRLLTGARCKCGKLVALSDLGAIAFDNSTMADGTKWTVEEARRAGQCRWRREGPHWKRGCAGDTQSR